MTAGEPPSGRTAELYPRLDQLGVVGDRRTAAVISADGAIRWLCLPNYDGIPVFGSLLDARQGGWWRLGPADASTGRSSYIPDSNVLVTTWTSPEGEIELTDAMLSPDVSRPPDGEQKRTSVRRLVCTRGSVVCAMELMPRAGFAPGLIVSPVPGGLELRVAGFALGLWASWPVEPVRDGVVATFGLAAGEGIWAVLGLADDPAVWTPEAADEALQATLQYWREWRNRYCYRGERKERVIRSALAIELLSFAPTGALAAAATTSLPERIGGDRNFDYRYAWIRDASMAIATLSVLGDVESAERYLSWLSQLRSSTEMPLQVLYRVYGGTGIEEHPRDDLAGYRQSRPVRFGNHAYSQRQIDCFGYLVDCAVIYLDQGGRWAKEYWQLIRKIADYTVRNWRKPSNGIWERDTPRHFVSSKVMSWTTLERALQFADRIGENGNLRQWRAAMTEIHADVMEHGWSDELQSFRQHYDADTLDASTLLIPLMGFLPPTHPRVAATVRCIESQLTVDGLIYRFIPDNGDLPLGRFEGAFLPCCSWLAAVYALMERRDAAAAMLDRVEKLTGNTGLFPEEADSSSGRLLGNIPMIFSHAEHARAILQLAGAWPRGI
ncbi:MAG: glycoside hydrolase family 15 protein [Alphaproteobacteria bacterium]|nr:glycoside hydrolase family 15 protein [Alphaproteobacteria bacterium]